MLEEEELIKMRLTLLRERERAKKKKFPPRDLKAKTTLVQTVGEGGGGRKEDKKFSLR